MFLTKIDTPYCVMWRIVKSRSDLEPCTMHTFSAGTIGTQSHLALCPMSCTLGGQNPQFPGRGPFLMLLHQYAKSTYLEKFTIH